MTTPTPTQPPASFTLWRRASGARAWSKVAAVPTHREAVALVTGKGDWWIAELRDPRLATAAGTPTGR